MYNQNPSFLASRFYAHSWGSIPILLHHVVRFEPIWDPDSNAWLHKPVCSCQHGMKCANPGKHPVVGWRQKPMNTPSEALQTASELLATHPHYGLALRTGPESNLLTFDIDIRPDKRGDLALMDGLARRGIPLEAVTSTLTQITGSGGMHFIFRYPQGHKVPTITNHPEFGPGVDIKGEGGMFNVAPSIHKNGKPYRFVNDSADPSLILDLPLSVLEIIEKKQSADPYAVENMALEAYTPNEEDILELAHKLKTQRKSQKLKTIAKNLCAAMNREALFLDGSAHDGFRDMAFQVAQEWPLCDTETVLELFRPAMEARQAVKPEASTDLENLRDSLETAKKKAEEFRLSWAGKLLRDAGGSLVSCISNFSDILENDPEIKGSLYYNNRAKMPALDRQLGKLPGPFPRDLDGDDRSRIARWMENKYRFKVSNTKDLFDCLCAVSSQQGKRDPFAEWLLNLPPWDGCPRLGQLLQHVGGAPDTEYVRTIIPIWFRGFVHRILEPGFKVDTMLILEGRQGHNKSTFFKTLLPELYLFNDSLHKLTQDEATLRLLHSGPVIHEIGDLAGFSRTNLTDLKAFLSACNDHVRPLYQQGRQAPRNFIIVGSTNEHKYLQDPTGARRFLPMQINRYIDVPIVLRDRDQLFAEALAGLRLGQIDFVSTQMAEYFSSEMEQRREIDTWEDPIRDFLDKIVVTTDGQQMQKMQTTVWEVLQNVCDMELKNVTRKEQMRTANCLKVLGWTQRHTKKGSMWCREVPNNPPTVSGDNL